MPPYCEFFRQTLLFPVAIRDLRSGKEGKEICLREWAAWIHDNNAVWEHVLQPFARDPKARPHERYAEFVYFHPFVQRFLYESREKVTEEGEGCEYLALLRRGDIEKLDVRVVEGEIDKTYSFDVNRVELWIFRSQVAVFVVEIESAKGLDEIGTYYVPDYLRRAYPPFWDPQGSSYVAQHFPLEVSWTGKDGKKSFSPNASELLGWPGEKSSSPLAEHWKYILEPLIPEPREKRDGLELQQLGDERMGSMLFLGFSDPQGLRREEMIRLTFLDSDRRPWTPPYSETVLKDFESTYCYDRFWDRTQGWMNTRYMCSGFNFVAVGRVDSNEPEDPAKQTHFRRHVSVHFQHHYFLMGLIVHFHRASLLMFSDRLSLAAARLNSEKSLQNVMKIQGEITYFVARFWFVEISSQMQAQDLFDLWTKRLGNDRLLRQLQDEKKSLGDFLAADWERRQTAQAGRLNQIAYWGLVGSGLFGFFGMNFVQECSGAGCTNWWCRLEYVFGVALILVMLLSYALYKGLTRQPDEERAKWVGWLYWSGVFGLLSLVTLWAYCCRNVSNALLAFWPAAVILLDGVLLWMRIRRGA